MVYWKYFVQVAILPVTLQYMDMPDVAFVAWRMKYKMKIPAQTADTLCK